MTRAIDELEAPAVKKTIEEAYGKLEAIEVYEVDGYMTIREQDVLALDRAVDDLRELLENVFDL